MDSIAMCGEMFTTHADGFDEVEEWTTGVMESRGLNMKAEG